LDKSKPIITTGIVDYRVNGENFDNYAPNNKADVEQIRNEISRKDSDVPIKDIETMFKIRKPVLNLQQLIIIKKGQIFELFVMVRLMLNSCRVD